MNRRGRELHARPLGPSWTSPVPAEAAPRRARHRRLASVGAALVAAAFALPAEASVKLNTPVKRPDAGHPSGHEFEISRKDCENAKDAFTFNLSLANSTDKQLEVWLAEETSLDCKLKASRVATADPHCVKITSKAPDTTLALEVTAADIAGMIDGVSGCVDSNSNTAARAFTLYFMLVDSSGNDVADADAATWSSKLDLLGPTPPTELEAGLGDGLLVISYTIPTSTDVDGFTVYCDPPASGTTTTTSSTSVTTGTGTGGGGGAGACSSSVLVPGDVPATTLASCGSAAKSASKANAKGLTNGSTYAVAISSHDVLGNVGPLSDLVCGTPAPVDDFFETYREAGGKGGGGCSIAGDGGAAAGGLLGGAIVALGLAARRTRRSKR